MKGLRQLISELCSGDYNERFKEIYVDSAMTEYQVKRYTDALEKYGEVFGEDEVAVFSAPGRSEVCGNHTDHQNGMVLAASVNLDSIAVVSSSDENTIRLFSEGYGMITADLSDLLAVKEEEGSSLSLIKGVVKGMQDRGYRTGGFKAYVTSNVMAGAGLSSSASFEVLIGTILSGLFNDGGADPVEIAQVSQYAENVYFGKPCGLMDQMACSIGSIVNIDFKIPEKPVVKKVEADFEKNHYSLCIVDTKGSHVDMTDEYAGIPREMKSVCSFFGKNVLRDVDEDEFYANLAKIREVAGDRAVLRAIHFFEEEANVQKAVECLEQEDFAGFLNVIRKSGNSSFKYLQNVYSVSDIRSQNISVALGASEVILRSHGVCRVHGGGFAGTIQAFVENDFVTEYRTFMERIFGEDSCHVLKVRKYGGMRVM